MSHTIKSDQVKLDQAAAQRAALHLGWQAQMGQARMYDGTVAKGLVVQLPEWRYPLVVEADGTMVYDNYRGIWGDTKHVEALAANTMFAMAGASWPTLVQEASGTQSWVGEVA